MVVLAAASPGQGAQSNVFQDVAAFDRRFGLPPAKLTVFPAAGVPKSDVPLDWWEESADVEVVHAVAPGASVRVLLLPPVLGFPRQAMLAGLRGADVLSVSGELPETGFGVAAEAQEHRLAEQLTAQGVTLVAASGDDGAANEPCNGSLPTMAHVTKGVLFPAADPLWLGVGDTSLSVDPKTGAYVREAAWPGSGSGFSGYFARPTYQDGVAGTGARRGVPDVAFDASPASSVVTVEVAGGREVVLPFSGTSLGAPFWAGVIALADQYAGRDLGLLNPAIYQIGKSPDYHSAFHDITSGDNSIWLPSGVKGYTARPGWDPVTGWGPPWSPRSYPSLPSTTTS